MVVPNRQPSFDFDDAFSTVLQRSQHVRSERGSEVSTWCDSYSSGSLLPLDQQTLEETLLSPMAPSDHGERSRRDHGARGEAPVYPVSRGSEEPVESSSMQYGKMLAVLENEARKRREEITDLRKLNSGLQKELDQERQTVELLRKNGPALDSTNATVSREMLAVLETEARNRRQETSDLRNLNDQLQKELEEERQTVIQLRRNGCSLDGSGSISREMLAAVRAKETEARRDLEQENAHLRQRLEAAQKEPRHSFTEELNRLRAENSRLRQELDSAAVGAEAQAVFREELQKLHAENERIRKIGDNAMSSAEAEARRVVEEEMSKLRAENEVLRSNAKELQKSSQAQGFSCGAEEARRKAAESELNEIKRTVQHFLSESHASLTGARSVCVQAEAAIKKRSPNAVPPPPVYDLQSRDIKSLTTVPDVLKYIADVLLEVAAGDAKSSWASRGLRYLVC